MLKALLLQSLVLAIAPAIGGILHMAAVRLDILASLKIPIDAARFGKNKTWRGVLFVSLFTAIGMYPALLADRLLPPGSALGFSGRPLFALGLLLGLAYITAELPNSLIKRRIGIAPGEAPERNKLLFAFIDQADSVIGCLFVYWLGLGISVILVLTCFLIGTTVHLAANALLYLAGLRKRPL